MRPQVERPLVAGVVTLSVIAIAAWVFQDGEPGKVPRNISERVTLRGAVDGNPLVCRRYTCFALPRLGDTYPAHVPFHSERHVDGHPVAGPYLLTSVGYIDRGFNRMTQTTDDRYAVLDGNVWDVRADEIVLRESSESSREALGNFIVERPSFEGATPFLVDPATGKSLGELPAGRLFALDDTHLAAVPPEAGSIGSFQVVDTRTMAPRTVVIPEARSTVETVVRLDAHTLAAIVNERYDFQRIVWIDADSLRAIDERVVPCETELVAPLLTAE